MYLNRLYEAWAEEGPLTGTEINRVAIMAIRSGNRKALRSLLIRQDCPESVIDLVKESYNPVAFAVWLDSRTSTDEDFVWFAQTANPELLKSTLAALDDSLNEKQLKLLWERDDAGVRIEVLKRIRWYHHNIPKSWGTWLLRAHRNGKLEDGSARTFRSLAESAPEQTWNMASGSKDLRVLCWVFQGMPDREVREWHVEEMRNRISRYLDDEQPSADLHDIVTETIVALLQRLDGGSTRRTQAVAGSEEAALAIRMLEHLDEDSNNWTALTEIVSIDDKESAPMTREAILEALAGGKKVPSSALESATSIREGQADTLWLAVASHPGLTVQQALRLVRKLDRWRQQDELDVIVKGRKPSWVVDLAREAWRTIGSYDRAFSNGDHATDIMRKVPWTQREKLMKELVAESTRNLDRLVQENLHTDAVLGSLPVEKLHDVDGKVHKALLRLTRYSLEDDEAAWEIFEALADSCSTTYKELLEAARTLAGERSES